MPVKMITGDFWAYPADVRINTVNCVGVMGAGIAKSFKAKYPDEMFIAYLRACKDGTMRPGGIIAWQGKEDIVIHFATKDHWRQPSIYAWIESGLVALREWLDAQEKAGKTLKVALPALGCSNGGLSFSIVSSMVNDELGQSNHEIVLFRPL